MTKPSLSSLSPYEIYALYSSLCEDFLADSCSPNWEARLVSGVEFANDRRAAGANLNDEEWAEVVREVVETY